MSEKTEQIEEQLQALTGQLIEKRGAVDALSLAIVDDPKSKTLPEKLEALTKEIASLESRIALFTSAKRASQERDTANAKARKVDEVTKVRDKAVQTAKDRVRIAKEIDAALGKVLTLAADFKASSDTCHGGVREVIRNLVIPTHTTQLDTVIDIARSSEAVVLVGALANFKIELQKILAFEFEQRNYVAGLSCESATTAGAGRVENALNGLIEKWEIR